MKTNDSPATQESSHVSGMDESFIPGQEAQKHQTTPFFSGDPNGFSSFFGPAPLQPQLEIGQPDDPYEREADQVAERVMKSAESGIQRKEEPEVDRLTQQSVSIQRKCLECEKEEVQRKPAGPDAGGSAQKASPDITGKIVSTRGEGNQLPKPVRQEMGRKIGSDFKNVKIHTDNRATQLNRQLGAKAFTVGNDIYFNSGQYRPQTKEGKGLLAHELTHTLQQGKGICHSCIQKETLEETAAEESTDNRLDTFTRSAFDTFIPVNSGFYFDISGGVTWGVPVYTGGRVRGEAFRYTSETLTLVIYKEGKVGFDAGVGAGFFIGKKRGQENSGSRNRAGLGGEAGVHGELGAKGVIIEQYDLPIDNFYSALFRTWMDQSFDYLTLTPGIAPVSSTMDDFLDDFSSEYHTRTKYRFGAYASATGELTFGARRESDQASDDSESREFKGYDATGESWKTYDPEGTGERNIPSEAPKITSGDPLALLNFLRRLFMARVSGDVVAGADFDNRGDKDVVSFYLEGEVRVLLGLPLPFLSQALEMLPNGAGAGIEFLFEYENGEIDKIKLNIYQYSGEDEIFDGDASKRTVTLNLTNFISVDKILEALESGELDSASELIDFDLERGLSDIEMWQRFSLDSPFFLHYSALLRRSQGARSLLSGDVENRSKALGINLGTYITLGFQFEAADLFEIVKLIPGVVSSASESTADSEGIADGIQRLYSFFMNFEDDDLTTIVGLILNSAKVSEAEIRIKFGGGGAISGKIAKGVKARFDASLEGGMFCATNLVDSEGDNLKDVLEKLFEIVDDPVAHLPSCLPMNMLYDSIGLSDRQGQSDDPSGHESDDVMQEDDHAGSTLSDEQPEGETADSDQVVILESGEVPGELTDVRNIQVVLESGSLTTDSVPDENEIHGGRMYFRIEGTTYGVDISVRLLDNDGTDEMLYLEIVEDAYMREIEFGFSGGTRFRLPHRHLF